MVTALGGAVGGVAAHHYGGKLLSYRDDLMEETVQEARDEALFSMQNKVDNLVESLKNINDKIDKQQSEIDTKSDTVIDQFKEDLEEVVQVVNTGRKSIEIGDNTLKDSCAKENFNDTGINKGMDALGEARQTLDTASFKLQALLDRINGKSNFWGESELKSLYEFLDSLTLLQELAFIHIVYILCILIVIWNIYSIIFANELVKYFNIEEKYPRWNKFFTLRRKYQRYYLTLNLIYFVVFSLFVLALDLLTLEVNPR